ncbi:MAG: hypothetical protein JW797_12875 [Bradymonadales bacterium]|nr:hypothetical protein [Bradymonadales bacterium]
MVGKSAVGSLLATGTRRGEQALDLLRTFWSWTTDPDIRSVLSGLIQGFSGATQLISSNTVRGLLMGEVVLSERVLNRWFGRLVPPEGVGGMELRCRPSRLVLVLRFDRRFLGFTLGQETIQLPFEVMEARADHQGGILTLRLDRDGCAPPRGLLQPLVARVLVTEASSVWESDDPLAVLDLGTGWLHRSGDRLSIQLERHPLFLDLMNREIPLGSGRSLLPFRLFSVHRIQVQERRLTLHMGFHTERILEDTAEQDALEKG